MQRIEVNGLIYEFEDDISLMSLLDENADRVYDGVATEKEPPNDPLPPEQLLEMDGEPVYLDFGDGGEWGLVRVQQGKVFIIHKNTICAPANILFECGGKAYCRKPEEEKAL